MRFRLFAGCLCVLSGALSAAELTVAGDGERPVRPYRSLTYTAEGIQKVRRVARETERGREQVREIFANVAPWLALSEAELRALIPGPDAVFARGTAGDPKTNQSWPSGGRSDDVCSLERPGTVRSPHTGDIYGLAVPGEPYHDPGDGWVRPKDEKRFYFKGIWNTWIVSRMHEAIDDLALAYMLTGDESIAGRALLLLDGMATLKAQRGEEPGFPDTPGYGGTNKHFLSYAGNGANARMVSTAMSLDLLGRAAAAQQSSAGTPGLSIFENVRQNYFAVYELSYKRSRHTLYNHTTALFANQIAQAVLFGDPDALSEGLEVILAWLEQCLTRDGQYYENAGGYERVGVDYFAYMLLPLENYRPENYMGAAAYPDPSDYPFNMRFGNDPRWYSAAYLMKYRMMACGRMICYGDMWEDRLVIPGRTRDWDPRNWCVFARLLYHQTDRPEWREEISRRYWSLPDEIRNESGVMSIRRLGMSQWFEPEKPAQAADAAVCLLDEPSDFIPGKMIALLRSGRAENHRTVFMPGSVHYSHGDDAQMQIIMYAKGMCLTGLYGYPFAGSPTHRGWSMKPASHWTLVVNEDLPAPKYPAKNSPSASLQALLTKERSGSAQMVEMSNPTLWTAPRAIAPDLTEYRRQHWMVDVSDEAFYSLDVFRVHGGRTHDYMWTGQWLDQADSGAGFSVEGVTPAPVNGAWTLAGFNRRYRNESFNAKGLSWGERLESGKSGRIASAGIPGEKINVDRNWNPPPENGYGFIYDVKAQQTDADWSASWRLIDGTHTMRLTFLNFDGLQAITAKSPTDTLDRHHSMAIARRRGAAPLRSRFAGLVEVATPGTWPVRQANRLEIPAETGLGVHLELADGRADTLLTAATAETRLEGAGVTLRGARAFVRRAADGSVLEVALHEGSELEVAGLAVRLAAPAWEAAVTEVLPDGLDNRVVVDRELPVGARLKGLPVIFSGQHREPVAYLHDESYTLEEVSAQSGGGSVLHVGSQRLVAAQVVVDSVTENGEVETTWPNEIRGGRFHDTGMFTGRRVAVLSEPERATVVAAYPNRKRFEPHEKGLFKAGDKLVFQTIETGDRMRIPAVLTLRRQDDGTWLLTATADVELRLPEAGGQAVFLKQAGQWTSLAREGADAAFCRVPLAAMPEGRAELRIGAGTR